MPEPSDLDAARSTRRSSFAEAWLVAGLTFRDLLRRPGGWIATLLTGMLFALLIGAVGIATARTEDRAETRSFKVAIGGDLEGARGVLADLATPRLNLTRFDDVQAAVTNADASAGIWFPDGVDALLDRGLEVEPKLYFRQGSNGSVEAYNLMLIRLQEIELARIQAAGGAVASGSESGALQVVVAELPRDERINRLQLARELAPVAALLCIGVVTSVAAVFGATRERRSIEPLLVQPLRRESIALGIALGAFPLACLQVLAAVILLVLTAAIPASALHQSFATLLAMLGAGVLSTMLLALLATGVGCFAGALGTGSDDAVGLGDLLAVPFVVVGVLVFAVPTLGGSPLVYAIPILGQVLLVRDTTGGTFDPLDIALTLASTIVVFLLLVRASGRRLDDERRILRASYA